MKQKAVTLLIRFYSWLLRLYPADFREEFRAEMTAVFTEAVREAAERGWVSLTAVFLREMRDWPGSVLQERLQTRRQKMNTSTKRVLFWTPRVLCILFAIFLSVFALDVFSEGYGFGETILALLMHLIPTILVVIALLIAWRWEGIGAALFIALPLFILVMSRGESWIISGPMFLVGVLFLFNWIYRAQLKTG